MEERLKLPLFCCLYKDYWNLDQSVQQEIGHNEKENRRNTDIFSLDIIACGFGAIELIVKPDLSINLFSEIHFSKNYSLSRKKRNHCKKLLMIRFRN